MINGIAGAVRIGGTAPISETRVVPVPWCPAAASVGKQSRLARTQSRPRSAMSRVRDRDYFVAWPGVKPRPSSCAPTMPPHRTCCPGRRWSPVDDC